MMKSKACRLNVLIAVLICLVATAAFATMVPSASFADEGSDLTAAQIQGEDEQAAILPAAAEAKATQLDVYASASAAVLSDGSLWLFGTLPAEKLQGVSQVASGGAYAAVKTDGTLWTWGSNTVGQVGDGTTKDRTLPVQVLDNVASVDSCMEMTAAVKRDGTLWMWGNGVMRPTQVMEGVSQVALSGYTKKCAVVKTDHTLWVWDGSTSVQQKNLRQVAEGVSQVSINMWGTAFAAVKTDGTLLAWNATNGTLFGGGEPSTLPTPTVIMGGVSQVSVGLTHAAAVKTDGTLWTWGGNDRGQLGNGTVVNSATPVQVMDNVAQAGVGGMPYNLMGSSFTMAIKNDGSLWVWGSNVSGKLADGSTEDKASPMCIFRNGKWITNDNKYHFTCDVPEREALRKFLLRLAWYNNDGSNSKSDSASDYNYMKATTYSDNIIANLIRHKSLSVANLTDGTYPVEVFLGMGGRNNDPQGKYGQYNICDEAAVRWVAQNIFNVSDADYATLQGAGENPYWNKYYCQDGKYYVQTGGVGVPETDIAVLSATAVGDRFNVFFRIRNGGQRDPASWDSEATQNDSTYLYAQVGQKVIDGKTYWTLYKLSKSPLSTVPDAEPKPFERLSGQIALDTMATIVDAGWQGQTGGTVVLTTVDGYWDALTAAGVAGMAKAPVLMTDSGSLSAQTEAVIRKLAPTRIVVCGGTFAVSDAAADAAAAAAGGARIVRCWGQTATGTAVDAFVTASSEGMGQWASQAFVCTNEGYWDALAAAPISYAKAMPIFLTEGAYDISTDTLAAMKNGGVKSVYIVGGTMAISDDVKAKIEAAGIVVTDRLWGNTAVETSEAVAEFGLAHGMTCARLGVATTNGYWDALAGAPLCGLNNSVLVLAGDASAHSISGFVASHKAAIESAFVFGGEAALDAATYQALRDATR